MILQKNPDANAQGDILGATKDRQAKRVPARALASLEANHDRLLKGDVVTTDQIEGDTDLKWEEVCAFEHCPPPVEYKMYYSC